MADSKASRLAVLGKGRRLSAAEVSADGMKVVSYLRTDSNKDAEEVVFAVSGHRDFCASAFYSGKIELWDMVMCRRHAKRRGCHDAPVWDILLRMDKLKIISAGADRLVKVWSIDDELETINLVHGFTGHTRNILALAADFSWQIVASGGSDRNIWLWNIDGNASDKCGRCLRDRHTNTINALSLAQRGSTLLLVSASHDGTVCISDIDSEVKVLQVLTVRGAMFRSLMTSDDATIIIACSGQFVYRWHADVGGPRLEGQTVKPLHLINDADIRIEGIEGDIISAVSDMRDTAPDAIVVVATTRGEVASLDFRSLRVLALDASDECTDPVHIGGSWDW